MPTVEGSVPAPIIPPVLSVTAPTVPVPVRLPPLLIVMALEDVLPVTESVPALTVVVPV